MKKNTFEPSARYEKKGYLEQDFRLFHLKDNGTGEFSLHYHDFYKLLLFINGNADYTVEGNNYILKPYDIVLVHAGELHRPVIQGSIPYERLILYLSPHFFESYANQCDLSTCFQQAKKHSTHRIRATELQRKELCFFGKHLIESCQSTEFGASLYQQSLLIEFLIWLNRSLLKNAVLYQGAETANRTVLSVMHYINEHLSEDLSIDSIAGHFFLNRSYLMHLFKQETGCTIGKYLTEKRLFLARKKIQEGLSMTEACYQSGFNSYPCFYRAFRDHFHVSPKKGMDLF